MKKLRNWLDRRRGIVARTQTGRPMRNADFYALADEAERGYDIEQLPQPDDNCVHNWRGSWSDRVVCTKCGLVKRV